VKLTNLLGICQARDEGLNDCMYLLLLEILLLFSSLKPVSLREHRSFLEDLFFVPSRLSVANQMMEVVVMILGWASSRLVKIQFDL
jgi:hypothetical protein